MAKPVPLVPPSWTAGPISACFRGTPQASSCCRSIMRTIPGLPAHSASTRRRIAAITTRPERSDSSPAGHSFLAVIWLRPKPENALATADAKSERRRDIVNGRRSASLHPIASNLSRRITSEIPETRPRITRLPILPGSKHRTTANLRIDAPSMAQQNQRLIANSLVSE